MIKAKKTFSSVVVRYLLGFVLALGLTLIVYGMVVDGWFELKTGVVAAIILGLAATQLMVHAIFFIDLDLEQKPRWKSVSFSFVILMMLVVLVGSLWVMRNLDYRMGMSPQQMQQVMKKESDKGF